MTSKITVLHVDDSAAVRDLTAELLERVDSGIRVLSEADPTQVPSRVRTEEIDCVVSDLEMPELNGIALCERLQTGPASLPFFLLTNHYEEELIERAFAVGVTDYIQKESGIAHYTVLANRIRNATHHYQARKRIEEIEDTA